MHSVLSMLYTGSYLHLHRHLPLAVLTLTPHLCRGCTSVLECLMSKSYSLVIKGCPKA